MALSMQSTAVQSNAEPFLIDVRTECEFVGHHLPGAIHIPYDQLDRAIPNLLELDRPIWVYSTYGTRSRIAALKLRNAGVLNVEDFSIDQLEMLLSANTSANLT